MLSLSPPARSSTATHSKDRSHLSNIMAPHRRGLEWSRLPSTLREGMEVILRFVSLVSWTDICASLHRDPLCVFFPVHVFVCCLCLCAHGRRVCVFIFSCPCLCVDGGSPQELEEEEPVACDSFPSLFAGDVLSPALVGSLCRGQSSHAHSGRGRVGPPPRIHSRPPKDHCRNKRQLECVSPASILCLSLRLVIFECV